MSIITSSTTHQVAAIGLLGCLVTHPALSSHTASDRILFTVVRRFLYVHQISIHGLTVGERLLYLKERWTLITAGPHRFHLNSFIVFVLKDVAQLPEFGKSGPAGFSGTRS